jgi:Ricin-type beta-trefoil lectin domain
LNNIGKRLNVPYFNQFVDPNNNQTPGDWNKGGWYMCTAAATTAIAAYYDTFPYKGANDEIYKQYMFSDGSLIGNNSEFRDNRLNKVSCPDKTQNYTKNWYGVYGYTGLESSDINTSCRGGSLPTIIQGLDALGLNHNTILSQDGFWSAPNQKSRLSIQQVKNSINAGRAIIFSTQNHIFTIKGYTTDNKIIVNDSWNDGNTNKTTYPSLYKFGAGFDAVYDLNNLYPIATDSGYQTHFYAIEVWREGFNPEANKITDPNITSVQPAQVDWRKVMDEGCLTADNSRVYMWDRFNNDCQKMRYQPSNNTITNPYGKCLDGGDVYNNASNRWIRYSSCNGGNNQKWKQDDNGRIWSLQKNSSNNPMCIEYYNTDNGSGLDVNPCNSNQGQKWYFDLGITREAVPSGANIVDNNINTIQPPQADWRWAMDSRCGTADNTQVIMKARDNGNCQKMRYNSSNNTITNPYGKCLDAGDINSSNNKWIRFSTCHYGNNQRWKQDNGGRIWSLAKNNSNQTVCIEYDAVADQYGINANGCNGNQSQKWYFDLGITKEEVPTNVNAYQINRYGYNQCIAVNNPGNGSAVYTTTCNPNDIDQLWEYVPSNTGGVMYRRKGTNKCIDRFQASQGANTYSWECDVTAGNHAWNFNSNNRLINQTANSSMCLATLATTSGTALQTYGCNASDNRFYWNLIGV